MTALLLAMALVAGAGCETPSRRGEASGQKAKPTAAAAVSTPRPARATRADIAEQMRQAHATVHAPSDGGGRAWIEAGPSSVTVGTLASWRIIYEAGDQGITDGGMVVFMVSPFWGWSPPQDTADTAPGYTTASTEAAGVQLTSRTDGSPMMGIAIGGRELRAGERVRIDYGGKFGARTDRFAESRSRFWIGVDGDGDGSYGVLEDSPAVEVVAGPARRLILLAPSTVGSGEQFTARLSVLDARGNSGVPFTGTVYLSAAPAGASVPDQITFRAADRGTVAIPVTAPATPDAAAFRIVASDRQQLDAVSNPIVTSASDQRIYWSDLHGHSALSDGTGTPEDYFRYARDIAALDIAALTDHDHWGVLPLDENPDLQREIESQVRAFHQPGSFVTLAGYEWTSWIWGHRHVLYFEDADGLYSSIDERYDTPTKLWHVLRGRPAITVSHHSAGGPIATDWSIPPDPELEPVTEVVSVHGVSEAPDSPSVIYSPQPGNFVRDALERGYRFGFVGSGDSHDGHPGLAHLASAGVGGVAAIFANELNRSAVLDAIRRRRVYATSGPRIYLRVALGTHPMGSAVPSAALSGEEPVALYVKAIGTDTIRWIDIVRSGAVSRIEVGDIKAVLLVPFASPKPGDYVYVRVIQEDGDLAWSSPIYLE